MKGSTPRKNSVRKNSHSGVSKARRAVLFINLVNKHARNLADQIAEELVSYKFEVDTFPLRKKLHADFGSGCDIGISLGGDGTVLSAARVMSPLGVPVFPVNLGTFGFIAGIEPEEWWKVFEKWLAGEAPISRRIMLKISVVREGSEVYSECSLNDVVISASGIAKVINLRVSYSEPGRKEMMRLGRYRSDGLIVSTPTGSTAYSASAGGPIVDPELDALIINPICPFTLSNRPIVLPADETVLVEVEEEQRSGVLLTVDGQVTEKLKSGDKVFLRKAPYHCLLVASGRTDFYQTLRTKLGWAGGGKP